MKLEEAQKVIEGLIFAAPYPISSEELGTILEFEPIIVERLIERIREQFANSGLMIRTVAGGYQFVTRPELVSWIDKLGRPLISAPLSLAGLETLAIIAYQQPLTKSHVEQIRGVRSDSAISTLLDRELIMEFGRKDGPGRPILYGTTQKFLVHFGLRSLDDLPDRPKVPRIGEISE